MRKRKVKSRFYRWSSVKRKREHRVPVVQHNERRMDWEWVAWCCLLWDAGLVACLWAAVSEELMHVFACCKKSARYLWKKQSWCSNAPWLNPATGFCVLWELPLDRHYSTVPKTQWCAARNGAANSPDFPPPMKCDFLDLKLIHNAIIEGPRKYSKICVAMLGRWGSVSQLKFIDHWLNQSVTTHRRINKREASIKSAESTWVLIAGSQRDFGKCWDDHEALDLCGTSATLALAEKKTSLQYLLPRRWHA